MYFSKMRSMEVGETNGFSPQLHTHTHPHNQSSFMLYNTTCLNNRMSQAENPEHLLANFHSNPKFELHILALQRDSTPPPPRLMKVNFEGHSINDLMKICKSNYRNLAFSLPLQKQQHSTALSIPMRPSSRAKSSELRYAWSL